MPRKVQPNTASAEITGKEYQRICEYFPVIKWARTQTSCLARLHGWRLYIVKHDDWWEGNLDHGDYFADVCAISSTRHKHLGYVLRALRGLARYEMRNLGKIISRKEAK